MKELVGEGDLSGPAETQYTRSVLDVPYGVVLLTLTTTRAIHRQGRHGAGLPARGRQRAAR
jgi:hypothetical protein